MRTTLTVILVLVSIDLLNGGLAYRPADKITITHFSKAFRVIEANEGHYSNHPNDKGGRTYLGITHKWNKHWPGWKTPHKRILAKAYYYKIWKSEGFDELQDSTIAKYLFDTRISISKKNCIKLLNLCGVAYVKQTKRWVNSSIDTISIERLKWCRCEYYKRLVKKDSSQIVFLKGWLRRSNKI